MTNACNVVVDNIVVAVAVVAVSDGSGRIDARAECAVVVHCARLSAAAVVIGT